MYSRLPIQRHIAENAKEAEEILVLQKCSRTPFVHFHGKPVLFIFHIRGQIELGRRKAVLRISYEMTVQPYIHRLLHAFKADDDTLSQKPLLQIKFPDIGTYRIIGRCTEHSLP